jgi:hypothetical protein
MVMDYSENSSRIILGRRQSAELFGICKKVASF